MSKHNYQGALRLYIRGDKDEVAVFVRELMNKSDASYQIPQKVVRPLTDELAEAEVTMGDVSSLWLDELNGQWPALRLKGLLKPDKGRCVRLSSRGGKERISYTLRHETDAGKAMPRPSWWEQDSLFITETLPDGTLRLKACPRRDKIMHVPDTVTAIAAKAFYHNTDIEELWLPPQVTSVGKDAFAGCGKLTVFCPPDSAGEAAALNAGISVCTEPASPQGLLLQIKHRYAYHLSEDGAVIDGYRGQERDALIPCSIEGRPVTAIGPKAFENKELLASVSIPDSVTYIGSAAFRGCRSLTRLRLPSALRRIGFDAFEACSGLTEVDLPEGVTALGYGAFERCGNLRSVSLPASIRRVDGDPFIGTPWFYDQPDGCIYANSILIAFKGEEKEVVIAPGTTAIAGWAFADHDEIRSIRIPDSVKAIGESAFEGCSHLREITLPAGLTAISNSAFEGCERLSRIDIPDSVVYLGHRAFKDCHKLSCLPAMAGVRSLGMSVFWGCRGLAEVIVPSHVQDIGWGAFAKCPHLRRAIVENEDCRVSDHAFDEDPQLDEAFIPGLVLKDMEHRRRVYYALLFCSTDHPRKEAESAAYTAYIRRQKKEIFAACLQKDKAAWLAKACRIAPPDLPETDELTETATGQRRTECTSFLLEYKHRHFSPAQIAAYESKRLDADFRPPTVAELRRSWIIHDNGDGTAAINGYKGYDADIVLPDAVGRKPVTAIGKKAFCRQRTVRELRSVTIPESVTFIGEQAFAGCEKMTIYAQSGSYAAAYAIDNHIPLKAE